MVGEIKVIAEQESAIYQIHVKFIRNIASDARESLISRMMMHARHRRARK